MVLESTMICLDNSDWMRNGDYIPSRLEAQKDAASFLCKEKTGSNPESTVGILTMAGNGVDMLASPTEEIGKILACFGRIIMGGKCSLTTAVQIAQLALKHRKNKNGRQRIVAFVGSPIVETMDTILKVGKLLKKNNVAVDVICFGEIEENRERLTEFVNATNSDNNSHLIIVPPGVNPMDAIVASPIMERDGLGGGHGGGGRGGGDFDMYGGGEDDPDMAAALRASAEDARMRSQQQLQGAAVAAGLEGDGAGGFNFADDDDEAMMQLALDLSMREMMATTEPVTAAASSSSSSAAAVEPSAYIPDAEPIYDDDEDEDLRLALLLSTGAGSGLPMPPPSSSDAGAAVNPPAAAAGDDFMAQLLAAADPDDPLIQAALAQMSAANKDAEDASKDEASKKRKGDDL